MTLTTAEALIIVALAALATMITRFLPFIIFRGNGKTNSYISYLGQVLPYAAIGLLVVYVFRHVNFTVYPYGIPEGIALLTMIILHFWKENTLLSIGVGTVIYMLLVQRVFI